MTQYRKIARLYTDERRMMRSFRRNCFQLWTQKIGNDLRGKKALDLGCGGGDGSRELAIRGAEVVGIDLERKMIRVAKEKEKKISFGIEYSIFDMEKNYRKKFGYHKFDLVTAIFSLHYAETRKTLEKRIRGIASSLKVNGRFVGVCPYITENLYVIKPFEKKDPEIRMEFVEGSKIKVSYINTDGILFSFSNVFWKPETYVSVFEKFGFQNIQWIEVKKALPARVLTADYKP